MFNFDRFEFRNVRPSEIDETAEIELLCFPENEACKREHMAERVKTAPETFLIAYDRINGKIAGFLTGLATEEKSFRDEYFTDASLHDPRGKTVLLLGLDVRPEYRHHGLGSELMQRYIKRERGRGRSLLLLTCHSQLVDFYENLGFEDLGIGSSSWGGVRWHDMLRRLGD